MEYLGYLGPLKQRRALICRSNIESKVGSPITVWVDDDERCLLLPFSHVDAKGRPVNPLLHFYRLDSGWWAVRCPRSLEEDEKWRIVTDIPTGAAVFKFKGFVAKYGKYVPKKKPKPTDGSDGTNDWEAGS